MYPELKIFSIELSSYNVMYFTAFVTVFLLCFFIAPKHGVNRIHIVRFFIIVIFVSFIGVKLAYFFTDGTRALKEFYIDGTRSKPSVAELFYGTKFFGGMLFAFLAAIGYCRITKIKPLEFMALILVYMPIGLAIGRIGCFLNGCCYGTEYHGIFAVNFPNSGWCHPLQLYEAVWYLITFAVLYIMDRKKAKRQYIIAGYIFAVAGIRFINEYLRPDANWALNIITVNQLLAIVTVAAMTIYIVYMNKIEGNKYEENS